MKLSMLAAPGGVALVALIAVVGSIAIADSPAETKPGGPQDFPLPPGWTAEDMQAAIEAGTPGEMHKRLAADAGEWHGKSTMWMAPGAPPIKSESKSTIEPMMDGRFIKCEMEGEMPGMGPYHGFGIYGYDNVSKEFVSTWIDNHGTGIMKGTGELSEDGKTLTWNYDVNCPITKKPTVFREVETTTGPNTKTLEMFGTEPKSGKEYKMMSIELTKKK